MPLHTLLTDTIESQGGSILLIKILNRPGACASADTLSRFVQYTVSSLRKNKMRGLSSDSFTIVSADNIDFMHSYAQVFCGNQTSSWHGTTVQAIHALPYLSAHQTLNLDPTSDSKCLRLPSPLSVDLSLEELPTDPHYISRADPSQRELPSRPSVDLSLEQLHTYSRTFPEQTLVRYTSSRGFPPVPLWTCL